MSEVKHALYHYKAIVTSVYDGDTITVDIDLGMGVWLKGQKIRLLGVNTPEIRGEERDVGILAQQFVRNAILHKEVILETIKDSKGKYGRWLANVYPPDYSMSLNDVLLLEGHATEYLKK